MLTTFQKAVLATIAGSALLLALVVAAKAPAALASTPLVGGGGPNGAALSVVGGNYGIAPGVVTTGAGSVKLKPDIAILSVGATVQASTAADAQGQVADRIARMLAAAKGLGVADSDIQTSSYQIHPQYAYDDRGGTPRITGYQAVQLLTITLNTVADAGKALDALVRGDGATNASITFALKDPKNAEAEARRLAIEDARSKAQAMASAAGVSLGKAIAINDQSVGTPFDGAKRVELQVGATDTQIPVGELEIVINVQVQFAIN